MSAPTRDRAGARPINEMDDMDNQETLTWR